MKKKDNQLEPGILYWKPGISEKGEIIRKLGQSDSPDERDKCYKSCGNLAPSIAERKGDEVDEPFFQYYLRQHGYGYIGEVTGKVYTEEFIYTPEIDDIFRDTPLKELYLYFSKTWQSKLWGAARKSLDSCIREIDYEDNLVDVLRYWFPKRTKIFTGYCRSFFCNFGNTINEIDKTVRELFSTGLGNLYPDYRYKSWVETRELIKKMEETGYFKLLLYFSNFKSLLDSEKYNFLSTSESCRIEQLLIMYLSEFNFKKRLIIEKEYLEILNNKGNH